MISFISGYNAICKKSFNGYCRQCLGVYKVITYGYGTKGKTKGDERWREMASVIWGRNHFKRL